MTIGIRPEDLHVATDADPDTTLSQWQLTDPSGRFAIDASTGTISLAAGATLDFEAAAGHTVAVSVYDGFRRSVAQNVAINLNNLNDNPPVVTAGQSFRIDGGSNDTVARVLAADLDDTNQPGFTTFGPWAITSGNPHDVFRYDSAGNLTVARPLLIDWRRTSYTLGTTVGDGTHTSAVQGVQVIIPNRVKLAKASLLRNQHLLHPRNKRGLDFVQALNDSFGLFSRNVLDIEARLFCFGEHFRVIQRFDKSIPQ